MTERVFLVIIAMLGVSALAAGYLHGKYVFRMSHCKSATEAATNYIALEETLYAAVNACMERGECDRKAALKTEALIEKYKNEFFDARRKCHG